tara:strand:+ start:36131 stop:38851 length:2721 start_codon:yes stop_codon:yes gene_type:complete
MQTFISEVVDALISDDQNLSDIMIIVPSRRAGGVFRNTLSRKLNKTIFAPSIYSIEEYIEHISGLKAIDQTEQLFTLYDVYRSSTPEAQRESFAVFYGWAQTVLHDFNEIDRFLVDHRQCFNYLSAIQDLNHWSKEGKGTELIDTYLAFWKSLPSYYEAFSQRLQSQHKGHQGLVYRKAAEDIEFYIQNNPKQQHVFLGFNALNTSEQQIIQALLATGNTKAYWDIDEWFLENPKHEAGMFMRSYRDQWPYYKTNPFEWIGKQYSQPKDIQVTAVSQPVAQAKYVGNLLANLSESELNNTAVVLSDETVLLPILNALPKNITAVNITMGVPLGQTPLASFFNALFLLHKKETARGFYYKHVISLLQHQVLYPILGKGAQQILEAIARENHIYLSHELLKQLLITHCPDSQMESLFQTWNNDPTTAVNQTLKCIDQIKNSFQKEPKDHILAFEYLFGFNRAFNKLKTLNDTYAFIADVPTLWRFYLDVLGSETLDLRGDPHKGLQIMGMLESRVLDFENVILTSVNEGILPAGKSTNSFIPYDVKTSFHLPTYKEKDAVYTYHFYRLLHRAKKVHLLYTTNSDGLGSNEKSRFILQMEVEGPHQIQSTVAAPSFEIVPKTQKKIHKTPEIIERLQEIAKSGFSPSSLTTYIRNPLDFYYRYVLRINDSDNVEETVAANTMGTIVHNALEALYKPFLNQKIEIPMIDGLFPLIEAEVARQFKESYGLSQIAYGKNLIINRVVCRYIENYLNFEKSRLKKGDTAFIKGLETPLKVSLPFHNSKLRGTVDLVEERNGMLHIVDYKTGKAEQKNLRPSTWEDLLNPNGSFEKGFQVLTYAYMMYKQQGLTFPVKAGIVSFKNLKGGFLPFTFDKETEITEETLHSYETILSQLISEIFNPEISFEERDLKA